METKGKKVELLKWKQKKYKIKREEKKTEFQDDGPC
jgi:hypothetical protein